MKSVYSPDTATANHAQLSFVDSDFDVKDVPPSGRPSANCRKCR